MSMTDLIKSVVIPFEEYILKDEYVSHLLDSEDVRARHNFGIAKLSVALIYDAVKARDLVVKASVSHKHIDIDPEVMRKYLSIFFKLHKKWAKEHFQTDQYYDQVMDKFDKLFMEIYLQHHQASEEDGFFMFDSEEIDEAIDNMHYEDEKKITAVEYFEYNEIIDDDLHDIIELADESDDLQHKHLEITQEFIDDFIRIIEVLARILYRTHEFKDIGYAMENFVETLHNLQLEELDDTKKEFAWNLISQINNDIQNWIRTIFIEQSAVDIHYFDASFLANIAQFDIMINQTEEEDDDFLF
ncbi:MAG: hypothetical protein GXO40_05340 [Epsilonproteobacteria bacterium]|nr:hypothetical protein [Campylobacterota bacterium]